MSFATVEQLSTRLGVELIAGSLDYRRAEAALFDTSVRAVEIMGRDYTGDDETFPEEVVRVVLAAALRVYRNPDRFLMNQAGSFQAQLPATDFITGDVFLAAEVASLEKYRVSSGSLWASSFTRDDNASLTGPHNPANYVPDPTNQGLGDPFYLGPID